MNKFVRYKSIVCCDSEYSLLLYFLLTDYKIEESLFFFSQRLNIVYRKKLNRNGIFLKTYRGNSRFIAIIVNVCYYFLVTFILCIKRSINLPTYGFDFLQFSKPIIKSSSFFCLIEDGLSNYERPNLVLKSLENSKIKQILFKIGLYQPPYGISDAVKKIYMTSLQPIPIAIKDKVECINISEIWNSLSNSRREEIISFFLDKISIPQSDSQCLIITQCWSEYNIMTESQKIDIYQKIVEKVKRSNRYDNIVLKTHPAETTDYSLYFTNVIIIKDPIPIQILELLGYKFNTMVTVNSTAIYSSECKDKILLLDGNVDDSELYKHLLERLKEEIL